MEGNVSFIQDHFQADFSLLCSDNLPSIGHYCGHFWDWWLFSDDFTGLLSYRWYPEFSFPYHPLQLSVDFLQIIKYHLLAFCIDMKASPTLKAKNHLGSKRAKDHLFRGFYINLKKNWHQMISSERNCLPPIILPMV